MLEQYSRTSSVAIGEMVRQPNSAWPPLASRPTAVTRSAFHLLAPNQSEWTYEGTNTWVVGAADGRQCVVVDPAVADESHLDAVLAVASSRGWQVTAVLVTHNHGDHAPGAAELRERTGAAIHAYDPTIADVVIAEGSRVSVDGLDLEVLHTPGHSDDSVTFWLPSERAMITGDTILGRRSSAVFGQLGEFLASASRLRDLADGHAVLLPGHGPPLPDAGDVIERAITVRRQRLEDVARLLDDGVSNVRALTDRLYPNVSALRRPAAEMSVRAARDLLFNDPQVRSACTHTLSNASD